MASEYEIFSGKSLSNLMEDIYTNQRVKKVEISKIIGDVRKLIKTPRDLITVGPTLSSLVNSSITNDDTLLKMSKVVQQLISSDGRANEGSSGGLSELEKRDLLKSFNDDIVDSSQKISDDVDELINDSKK